MSAPVPVADVAAGQRQILRDLAAEYGRQLRQILQVGELVKGSVYPIETRCGNPGCHCAMPHGRLHPATVLSWSEAGRTRMRSLGVDQRDRIRRLSEQYRRCGRRAPMWSGCTNRCCTPSINWNKPCACRRPPPLAGHAPPARAHRGRVVEIRYRQSPQDAELFAQALRALPVESWWEDWMRHADRLLEDPELVNIVHQVQLKRWPK